MKVVCNSTGKKEVVEITEEMIQERFREMQQAYYEVWIMGDWSDYGDCNRAIDDEIERRVKNVS